MSKDTDTGPRHGAECQHRQSMPEPGGNRVAVVPAASASVAQPESPGKDRAQSRESGSGKEVKLQGERGSVPREERGVKQASGDQHWV